MLRCTLGIMAGVDASTYSSSSISVVDRRGHRWLLLRLSVLVLASLLFVAGCAGEESLSAPELDNKTKHQHQRWYRNTQRVVNQNPEVFLGVFVLDESGLGVVTQPGIDHGEAVALLRPPPTSAELELSSCPQHRREFEALQSEVIGHLRGSEGISIPFGISPDYKTCQVNLQGEFSNVETADLLDTFGPMLRFTIRPGPVGGTFDQ